jgi:integrase
MARKQGTGYTIQDARENSMQRRWRDTAYARTAAIYSKQVVEQLGPWRPLLQINYELVESMMDHFLRAGNSPGTVNKKRSALRAMLTDASARGWIQGVPAMPKQLANSRRKDRVISPQEEEAFCLWFERMEQPEAAALFRFLIDTGCRWGEAEKLVSGDVNLTLKRVTFHLTKSKAGPKNRTIRLTGKAYEAVRHHVSPTHRDERVWSYGYDQYRHLFDAAKDALGLGDDKQVTIHILRHTCASRLSAGGITLQKLQAWGGWDDVTALQRYVHLNVEALEDCVTVLEGF